MTLRLTVDGLRPTTREEAIALAEHEMIHGIPTLPDGKTAFQVVIEKTEKRMIEGPTQEVRVTGRMENGQFIAETSEWPEEIVDENGNVVMKVETVPLTFIDSITLKTEV